MGNSTLTSYRSDLLSLAMAGMGNDTARRTAGIGLALAVASAAAFGLSGRLARGLLDAGWSPGAVVLARLALGALVVAPFAARALRGRWGVLRRTPGSCCSSAPCQSRARSSPTSPPCSGWTSGPRS